MDALKDTATNLQLYFQLGDIKSFEKFNTLLNKNFNQKEEFPKEVNDEMDLMQKQGVRIDFVHIAHRLYEKKGFVPNSFEQGLSRCTAIINTMMVLKDNLTIEQ